MKKMIRAMCLWVALCLLLAVAPATPASAAGSATLSVSSTSLSPGDTVTVTVGFQSDEPLRGADITVSYPSDVFSYVSHSFSENVSGSTAPRDDSIQFLFWYNTPGAAGNAAMTLGTITLMVKDSPASSGDIAITKAEGSSGNTGRLVYLGANSVTVSTGTAQSDPEPAQPAEEPSQPEREASNLLASLTVSNATLSPAFDPENPAGSYSCSVPYEVDSLDIQAVPVDPEASVAIQNNQLKASGTTAVVVTVVPAPGSGLERRNYNIMVTRAAPPDAPMLTSLEVIGYQISPAFSPDVMEYTCQVPSDVTAVDVNAVCSDPEAVVELSSLDLSQENPTGITVTVSKEGHTPRVYEISITREDAHSSRLSSLSITEASLSPSFEEQPEPGSIYSCTVPYQAEALHITAVPEDSAATIRIENNVLIPGTTSRVTITVSCEGEEDSVYCIDATRPAQPEDGDANQSDDDSGFRSVSLSHLIGAVVVLALGGAGGIAVFLFYAKARPRIK